MQPLTSAGLAPLPPAQAGRDVLALVELLERDGHVRLSVPVHAWPLRIGRALDNDVVLADPHVAGEHLRIEGDGAGEALQLVVGDTRNGVRLQRRLLRAGETLALPAGDAPLELQLGRTRLRLRRRGEALLPEVPLAAEAAAHRRWAQFGGATLVLLAGLLFNTWLENDPDGVVRAAGSMLLTALAGGAVWCGLWALLSKTFTRQSHFFWHLRVFVFACLAWLLAGVVPAALAFAFSWAWVTDFSFMIGYAIAAAALYFHLLAVEPARPRLMRWVALTAGIVGIAVSLWFNVQRNERYGEELYMSHLFPPALRLARPVPVDAFVQGLAPLRAGLDKKANEPATGDTAAAPGDDEE